MGKIVTGVVGDHQEERNRQLVLDFYENVIVKREYERWPEYLRPDYIQHKPNIGDGTEGVIDFMKANYARHPKHTVEVLRAFADGDYVFLHVHVCMQPFSPDLSVMDIFRVEGGKLAEHWDVEQPVPAEMGHANGMF
jgi:predicted SnoaL-like aldol condensation-catalyzing enzyme